MAYTKSDRGDAPMRRRGMGRRRKKVCVFCGKENNEINYKDVAKLKRYVSGERKNPSQKNHRKLCKAPESSDCSYQESTSHFPDAVRNGLIHLRESDPAVVMAAGFCCSIGNTMLY